MFSRFGPIRKAVALAMMVVAGSTPIPARAQFVPGHIFAERASANLCETDKFGVPFDIEYIWELNPETGEVSLFAFIPQELCGFITGMAMSPDGKRLRVASWLQNAIFEFDSQGNMSVALDWWDGIRGPEGSNCIAYDRHGNFYVSNFEGANVLMFPADGSPGIVIAEHEDEGVQLGGPHALAVATDGTVYVATFVPDSIVRITPAGHVSVVDSYYEWNAYITSIAVDMEGTLFVRAGDGFGSYLYRYPQGASVRDEYLNCAEEPLLCRADTLSMSADYSMIVGRRWNQIVYIDPVSASIEQGPVFSISIISNYGTAVVPLRGDINSDGAANLVDYSILESCMLGPYEKFMDQECDIADLDADGDVDLFDMRFFQRAFGGSR